MLCNECHGYDRYSFERFLFFVLLFITLLYLIYFIVRAAVLCAFNYKCINAHFFFFNFSKARKLQRDSCLKLNYVYLIFM